MNRYEPIHEQINTYVMTKNGQPIILAFQWKGCAYKITKNNLMTKAKKGNIPVYLFSVSNESGAYKLRFDTDTLHWWLEEILWEE
jgi:hypothetical protein